MCHRSNAQVHKYIPLDSSIDSNTISACPSSLPSSVSFIPPFFPDCNQRPPRCDTTAFGHSLRRMAQYANAIYNYEGSTSEGGRKKAPFFGSRSQNYGVPSKWGSHSYDIHKDGDQYKLDVLYIRLLLKPNLIWLYVLLNSVRTSYVRPLCLNSHVNRGCIVSYAWMGRP